MATRNNKTEAEKKLEKILQNDINVIKTIKNADKFKFNSFKQNIIKIEDKQKNEKVILRMLMIYEIEHKNYEMIVHHIKINNNDLIKHLDNNMLKFTNKSNNDNFICDINKFEKVKTKLHITDEDIKFIMIRIIKKPICNMILLKNQQKMLTNINKQSKEKLDKYKEFITCQQSCISLESNIKNLKKKIIEIQNVQEKLTSCFEDYKKLKIDKNTINQLQNINNLNTKELNILKKNMLIPDNMNIEILNSVYNDIENKTFNTLECNTINKVIYLKSINKFNK